MLHIETPLLRSTPLSTPDRTVWLKLENTQPSGSFKMRGMGRAVEKAVERGAERIVSSSGGNAGLAVACASRALGVACTIVVPSRTPVAMREKIAAEGVEVLVHGTIWDDAHEKACSLSGTLIHPFDPPDVWQGHATLIDEVAPVLKPDHVVLSVGGGGLMIGVLMGMARHGWGDVPLTTIETHGADSFAQAVEAGQLVTLPGIDSIALTLGARRVADEALMWAMRHDIRPLRVTDRAAVEACSRFLDDHRMLVEPACGAALAPLYAGELMGDVLVIVCGGASATREQLEGWEQAVDA